jgi:ABC-type uncharacterized transport system auxiliary subunit
MPRTRESSRTGRRALPSRGPGAWGRGFRDPEAPKLRGRKVPALGGAIPCVLLALAVLLSTAGCVRIPRERLEIRRYSLDAPAIPEPPDTEFPGAAARASVLPVRVLLSPFTADARQRGERMLFRSDENRLEYYFYHRWIASPERMIEDILASELNTWGICGGGLHRPEAGLIPTHEILGRLTALYADNRKNSNAAVLEVALTVMRVDPSTMDKKIVFQKTYTVTEPRKNNRVDTFVQAANRAVERWLIEVRPDLEGVFRGDAVR